MPIQHFDPTIAALAEHWFLGPELGPKYGNILTRAFNARADQQAIDDALSLGGYLLHTESNKRQRHVMRAVLLADFLMKEQPVALHATLREQYKTLPTEALTQKFKHLFPAFLDNDKRASWAPGNFTDPRQQLLNILRQPHDWSRGRIPFYKFIVHTLKHRSASLINPIKTLSGWTAISMSVLSSTKQIAYSNHGFILHVPENNVLTTSPTDQWFDNYAGTDKSHKASPGQSMAQHIGEKTVMLGGLLTPDEVLLRQGTDDAMDYYAGAAQTTHNEIVVCGVPDQPLPHGKTGRLRLLGLFVQTTKDGTLPRNYFKSQGPTQEILKAMDLCSRRHQVPLLYLPAPDVH